MGFIEGEGQKVDGQGGENTWADELNDLLNLNTPRYEKVVVDPSAAEPEETTFTPTTPPPAKEEPAPPEIP